MDRGDVNGLHIWRYTRIDGQDTTRSVRLERKSPGNSSEVAEEELGVERSSALLHDALDVRELGVVLQRSLHQSSL
jgi:hypothetical protein